MKTLSIKLPEKKYQKLKKVDIEDVFLQFVDDYLEYEEDMKLKKEIEKSKNIKDLTDLISKNL